jgi:formimidoylglutamate deiminase
VLRAGDDGRWSEVTPGVAAPPPARRVLDGRSCPAWSTRTATPSSAPSPAGPSGARRSSDDFWSWRDRMYRVALRIAPAQLRDVAAQLYVELLQGGYTQVCEFHYLQHGLDGRPYDDPLEMSWALADAAAEAGIGLTLLPVLYERAGFGKALRDDQRRFRTSAEQVWQAATTSPRRAGRCSAPGSRSIRCARRARSRSPSWRARPKASPGRSTSTSPSRPRRSTTASPPPAPGRSNGWRASGCSTALAARACDAHGGGGDRSRRAPPAPASCSARAPRPTSATASPTCPAGSPPASPLAIGSDSHVGRDWREELRWLEYGQRLRCAQRNVAAARGGIAVERRAPVRPRRRGSAAAAGEARWGLVAGARADALVVDPREAALLGLPRELALDALVFSESRRGRGAT